MATVQGAGACFPRHSHTHTSQVDVFPSICNVLLNAARPNLSLVIINGSHFSCYWTVKRVETAKLKNEAILRD